MVRSHPEISISAAVLAVCILGFSSLGQAADLEQVVEDQERRIE